MCDDEALPAEGACHERDHYHWDEREERLMVLEEGGGHGQGDKDDRSSG